MAQNLTNFDKVLKDYYEGPVREHLNNKVTLLQYTEKSSRKWQGRAVVFPINLSRNSGVGARGASGTLPTAGNQGYVESRIESKFLYGRIEVSGPVIAASRGDKGAFVSALKSEISGMRRDLRVDMCRQSYGNAEGSTRGGVAATGVLGHLTGGGSYDGGTDLTTFTVDNPGTRYIKKGMNLTLGTVADSGASELDTGSGNPVTVTVNAVTSATQFTVSGNSSANTANNDRIVRGNGTATSTHAYNNEITGIDYMIQNSGKLQTIDPTADPEWKANVLGNSGTLRPLSLELMQLAIDNTDEVSGEEPDLIIGHHSIRREYINLLTSDVRYAPEQLKGGFQKLTYAGGTNPITFEFDRYAPYNKVYFVHTPDIKQYVLQDWKWADRDGSVMNRVADADRWEAFMCWYGNLGLDRRHSQTVLEDISVSNTIF